MFILDWYREWLDIRRTNNPGSPAPVCNSCETLNHQLEVANFEKKQLLDRILELTSKTPIPQEREVAPAPQVVGPRRIPWKVRQQMLEAEDRAKFAAQQQAAKADEKPIVDVSDMEEALDVATETREAKTS